MQSQQEWQIGYLWLLPTPGVLWLLELPALLEQVSCEENETYHFPGSAVHLWRRYPLQAHHPRARRRRQWQGASWTRRKDLDRRNDLDRCKGLDSRQWQGAS